MKYKDYLIDLLDKREIALNQELYSNESLFKYARDEEYIDKKNLNIYTELELLDNTRKHIKHFM